MYRIQGADHKEYGPISADQVRQWITENRLNRNSLASAEASPGWKPLGQFPEFADVLATQAPAVAAAPIPPPPGAGVPDATIGAVFPAGTRESALRTVSNPAIALIVVAGIGLAYSLLNLVTSLLSSGAPNVAMPPNMPPEMEQFMKGILEYSKSYGVAAAILSLIVNGVALFGGIRMKELSSPALCWAAAILVCIPCFNQCCCVGLPIGIWVMVTLNNVDVKAHLR